MFSGNTTDVSLACSSWKCLMAVSDNTTPSKFYFRNRHVTGAYTSREQHAACDLKVALVSDNDKQQSNHRLMTVFLP